MPRAYLRLDPSFDERKEAYPDGPYAALIATFCLAEHQPQRGRFRSREYLARLLGKRGRHVPYLLEHGDIVAQPDGRIYVEGWDEWQEGDWKVAERVARIRERKRGNDGGNGPGNGVANADVTPDVTVARYGDGGGGSGGVAEAVTDPVVAYMRLTGTGRPSEYAANKIRVNAVRYGHDEWLFAVNQAREAYGSKNDIKNAEAIAEEALLARQQETKRRKDAEREASRVTPEQAEANRRRLYEIQAEMLGKKGAA